jgi:hypothetical protein
VVEGEATEVRWVARAERRQCQMTWVTVWGLAPQYVGLPRRKQAMYEPRGMVCDQADGGGGKPRAASGERLPEA